MRLVALILIAALAGPSAAALVCDRVCATKHQSAAVEANCHDEGAPGSSPTLAAGYECHQPGELIASVLTNGAQSTDAPLIVESVADATGEMAIHVAARRPDRSHAPPPSLAVQLRI